MNKEELIARLKTLAEKLGREVNLTGSKEELVMRVAELEEEIGDDIDPNPDDEDQVGGDPNEQGVKPVAPAGLHEGLTKVKPLFTLHVEAVCEFSDERLSLVEPGTVVRVSSADADELVKRNLAVRL
ncbi:hypothetical protein B5M10_03130 [Pluralibacter gergoviae]|uniref:DNA-packaging protein FI n=1 Tax=Pluralibacter gergoviae TaxID=61647 RepID=UPI000907E195|nr:DNA-packaging protein FI [Pluralibacter gergoviae]OUR04226.1 hypothetical protein B5M10_03130 [Pluralibacter gergoviae]